MNPLLILCAKEYGKAFDEYYGMYCNILDQMKSLCTPITPDSRRKYWYGSHLRTYERAHSKFKFKYESFITDLQHELSLISDPNEQKIMFTELKTLLRQSGVFDNVIICRHKSVLMDEIVEVSASKIEGELLLAIIQDLSDALKWIDFSNGLDNLAFSADIINGLFAVKCGELSEAENTKESYLEKTGINKIEYPESSEIDSAEASIVKKVFDKCNGIHWESVDEKDFADQIETGNMNLKLIKNHTMTQVLFNNLKVLFNKNNDWVGNVEKSLSYKRLNKKGLRLEAESGNPAKEFNAFLDELKKLKET